MIPGSYQGPLSRKTKTNDHVFSSYDVKVQYELNKFLLKDDACMISYHVLKEKVDFSPTFA